MDACSCALARLNERDREALTLVAWDGLTPAQAAAVLGEPSVRFRQRLHRAGRRLRTQLAAELSPRNRRHRVTIAPPPEAPHEHPTSTPILNCSTSSAASTRCSTRGCRPNAGLDTESALRLLASELDRPPAPRRARRRRRLGAAHRGAGRRGRGGGVRGGQRRLDREQLRCFAGAGQDDLIRRARDALVLPSGAISRRTPSTTVTARDGATIGSEVHEWLSTSSPYDNRIIQIQNGKVQWEQAFVNGRLDLYDPATNTVYLAPRIAPNQVPDNPNWNSALAEVQYLLGSRT